MGALFSCVEAWRELGGAGVVGGRDGGSSDKRVSLHQKLCSIRQGGAVFTRKEALPERRFAIRNILSFPLDHIEDVKDAVLLPVLIQNTIQYGVRW
jgi:hypothetical protein